MNAFIALLIGTLLLGSTVGTFADEKSKPAKPPVVEVTLDEAEKLAADTNNVVVLDVRTRKEFAAGHLAGAKNLDFYAPDFEQQLSKLDKSTPFLVHCATGGRSAEARDKMKALGFKTIYHMDGGYKAWSKAGKKVVQ